MDSVDKAIGNEWFLEHFLECGVQIHWSIERCDWGANFTKNTKNFTVTRRALGAQTTYLQLTLQYLTSWGDLIIFFRKNTRTACVCVRSEREKERSSRKTLASLLSSIFEVPASGACNFLFSFDRTKNQIMPVRIWVILIVYRQILWFS